MNNDDKGTKLVFMIYVSVFLFIILMIFQCIDYKGIIRDIVEDKHEVEKIEVNHNVVDYTRGY